MNNNLFVNLIKLDIYNNIIFDWNDKIYNLVKDNGIYNYFFIDINNNKNIKDIKFFIRFY